MKFLHGTYLDLTKSSMKMQGEEKQSLLAVKVKLVLALS